LKRPPPPTIAEGEVEAQVDAEPEGRDEHGRRLAEHREPAQQDQRAQPQPGAALGAAQDRQDRYMDISGRRRGRPRSSGCDRAPALSLPGPRATRRRLVPRLVEVSMVRVVALFSAAAVMLGIAAGYFFVLNRAEADQFAQCRRSQIAGGAAAIGGPFSLVDTEGRRVTEAEAITRPTLIYFGYSFCPDFCPMDLSRNAAAADLLAERGIEVDQVFITVDPERDTPEALADFVPWIHPDLVGLSGTPEETATAANAYRVYFRRGEGDDEFYLVDHSTFTYLMAPGHGFLEFFPTTASPDEMADSVACYAERI
jgi:protein SCO1